MKPLHTSQFWVYQDVTDIEDNKPYALQIFVDLYRMGGRLQREFSITFYHENIPGCGHDSRLYRKYYASPDEFISDILALCRRYNVYTAFADEVNLYNEFLRIVLNS